MKLPGKTTFPASLRISRWDSSVKDSTIGIVIRDESSRVIIAEVELTPQQFGLAITGLLVDELPCETYVEDQRLGRKLVVENRQAVVDDLGSDVRLYKQYLNSNCSEPNKILVWNANSQSAKQHSVIPGKIILNYSLHSYETVDD